MSKELFDLSGKVALLTGARHGLGLAMAVGFAKAGAKVVFTGLNDGELQQGYASYQKEGVEAKGYVLNVTNAEEVEKVVADIKKTVGSIDIVVNNAGIIMRKPLTETTGADFAKVFDVHVVGAVNVSRAVVGDMIEKKEGKIINICSMMSELGRDQVSAYAAAKGAMKMLTRSMATEWAAHNIQVNGIGPGYFITEQTAQIHEENPRLYNYIISRTPAGRWGKPEDLSGAAIFLASKAADFVNGHIIYVDGGILATLGNPNAYKI